MKKDRITQIDPRSENIAEDLLEFRLQALLSQNDLAVCVGTSTNQICKWEKGSIRPSMLSMRKVNNFIRKYWEGKGKE